MLIIGARGFAKEVLGVLKDNQYLHPIAFFDDQNKYADYRLFDQFLILKDEIEVQSFFNQTGSRFTLGIGNPVLRYKMYIKFKNLNGVLSSTISAKAVLGSFKVEIGSGSNILPNAMISNDVTIGQGVIVYYNAIITHDCIVGNFAEISPGAILLGRCQIGNFTSIGANATILPDIRIGQNVVVSAGAVVNKDVADNCMVAGAPAVVKKELPPIEI